MCGTGRYKGNCPADHGCENFAEDTGECGFFRFIVSSVCRGRRVKMREQFVRTEALIGKDAMEKLQRSRVAVFGLGGVGGYVCEALVRSGIGHFDLIDHDKVSITNLNRQIIATHATIGLDKADVVKERMLSINPDAEIRLYKAFFLPENADEFPFKEYEYVVDAVDTVTAKIELVLRSQSAGVPVISSMGTGNKLDPGKLRIADIYETKVCPLARVMRRELRKRDVNALKVVYSEEIPVRPADDEKSLLMGEAPAGSTRRDIPGSTAFVPAAAGLMIASEIVRDICRNA